MTNNIYTWPFVHSLDVQFDVLHLQEVVCISLQDRFDVACDELHDLAHTIMVTFAITITVTNLFRTASDEGLRVEQVGKLVLDAVEAGVGRDAAEQVVVGAGLPKDSVVGMMGSC